MFTLEKHNAVNSKFLLDYEQSLFFSKSVERKARDTKMTTRMLEGARRKRLFSLLELPPSFQASRGFTARRSRPRALPPLNLKKKRDFSQSNRFFAHPSLYHELQFHPGVGYLLPLSSKYESTRFRRKQWPTTR